MLSSAKYQQLNNIKIVFQESFAAFCLSP